MNSIPFIGRENELKTISQHITDWDSSHVLIIDGPGGIGKTTLLNKTAENYGTHKNFLIPDVINFDNHFFQTLDNVGYQIAVNLGAEKFTQYIETMIDFRKQENAGISQHYDYSNIITINPLQMSHPLQLTGKLGSSTVLH